MQAFGAGQRRLVESDGVHETVAGFEHQLEMRLAHHALVHDVELTVEGGLGKRLSPGPALGQAHGVFQGDLGTRELPVGFDPGL